MHPPRTLLAAARIILEMTQSQVADAANLGIASVVRAEKGDVRYETVARLVEWYESKGILFQPPENGSGWSIHCANFKTSFENDRRLARKD